MKKKEWTESLNHLDTDLVEKYVEHKERLRQKNKKTKGIWHRFGAIAACFVVIAVTVIAGIAYREYSNQPIYLDNGKIDILSLSGAQIIPSPPNVSQGSNGDIYPPEDFASILKESDKLVVYGTVQNLKTVKVEEVGAYSWYVSTFDIHVIEEICNGEGAQIISVVAAARYYNDTPEYICGLSSNFELSEQVTGLFSLNENTDEVWHIAGAKLTVYDLGDYRTASQFDCNGESFNYFGYYIDLDELRDTDTGIILENPLVDNTTNTEDLVSGGVGSAEPSIYPHAWKQMDAVIVKWGEQNDETWVESYGKYAHYDEKNFQIECVGVNVEFITVFTETMSESNITDIENIIENTTYLMIPKFYLDEIEAGDTSLVFLQQIARFGDTDPDGKFLGTYTTVLGAMVGDCIAEDKYVPASIFNIEDDKIRVPEQAYEINPENEEYYSPIMNALQEANEYVLKNDSSFSVAVRDGASVEDISELFAIVCNGKSR